jgi:hypothetical protein
MNKILNFLNTNKESILRGAALAGATVAGIVIAGAIIPKRETNIVINEFAVAPDQDSNIGENFGG